MSDNKEKKPKDVKELPVAAQRPGDMLNDLNELMEWMASPRIYWDNFSVALPIENNNDIKWIQVKVEEA